MQQTEEYSKALEFINKLQVKGINNPVEVEVLLNQEDDETFLQITESVLALTVKHSIIGGGIVFLLNELLERNVLDDILIRKNILIEKRKILTPVIIGVLFETTQLKEIYGRSEHNNQQNKK